MKARKIDRVFLIATAILVVAGFFIFSSASLGLLAREGARFSSVAVSQLVLGIGLGVIACTILAHIPYRTYRNYAPYIFGAALFLTALTFVPALSYEAGGASRWLNVFGTSFQPAEFLKIAFIICLAWYYASFHARIQDIRYALGGLVLLLGCAGILLLLQPDTGTFLLISATGVTIYIAAGARITHLLVLGVVMLGAVSLLALAQPYVMDRISTFMDPSSDPRGSGYQIKQSLIAVGSGGWFGRGYGQSVQKFSYLPEPIGDSVFSVAAEEFGFLGSTVLIGFFVFFALRGLQIAAQAPDRFGGLMVVGIVILVIAQSFVNIGSMLGLVPLTGEPLTFVSHGGTSLMFALAAVGIVLNVSRYRVSATRKTI
jgi:cell division protein FtsW